MKTYIKLLVIMVIILVSLILLKYTHMIVGITFFVIGMGLLVYYGFINKNCNIQKYIIPTKYYNDKKYIIKKSTNEYYLNFSIKKRLNIDILPGLPNIIWILWFQGYKKSPYVVKEVIDSWYRHNPDWNIILLTNKNIHNYIDIVEKNNITLQAKSDLIRLKLLSTYGGVWVDATLLCMQPLNNWIFEMIKSVGFWMYHNGKGPCSWFIISSKNSLLIQEWNKLCENYWMNREEAHNYGWMDILFKNDIIDETSIIYKEWKNVPIKDCEEIGSSHYLAGRVSDNLDEEVEQNINRKKLPYVIKLDKKLPELNLTLLNGHYTIFMSKTRDLIIAHCMEDLNWIINNNISNNFNNIYIYSKCYKKIFETNNIPNNIFIQRLENSGQDAGTVLYHIINNWNNLADFNVFSTGKGLEDICRGEFNIKNILYQSNLNMFNRYEHKKINLEFTLDDYTPTNHKKNPLPFIKSQYENIRQFASAFLDKYYLSLLEKWKGESSCTTFGIDKHLIYKNPIKFYKKLYDLVDIGPNNINVHFLERLWVFIFKSTIFRPKLFCFWTGNNKMSTNRMNAYETIYKSKLDVRLITPNNLEEYILPEYPLHPGYQYLSETHKSDYLRCYFMHIHGGGYSDIKITERSWLPAYNILMRDDNLYAVGYPEIKGGSVYINEPILNINYKLLIGQGGMLCKPNTPFTIAWYNDMINTMDINLEQLKKYPSLHVRQVYSSEYPYPLEWGGFGANFHRNIYKYHTNIIQILPYDGLNKPYR